MLINSPGQQKTDAKLDYGLELNYGLDIVLSFKYSNVVISRIEKIEKNTTRHNKIDFIVFMSNG